MLWRFTCEPFTCEPMFRVLVRPVAGELFVYGVSCTGPIIFEVFRSESIMKQHVQYRISLRVLIALFSLLTMSVGISFGQAISGNLVGTITDSCGALVANAEVTATNAGTSSSAVTHT